MRRLTPAIAALLAAAAFLTISGASGAASSTCSDSWGSDGHSGPWYVGSNQSLHGNTLIISCPSGSTAWNVDYWVEKTDGSTIAFPIKIDNKTGTGSTSFNFSRSPIGCNQGWNYFTYVHNNVTGGNISKPADHSNVIC